MSKTVTYLDHNATTPVKPSARAAMLEMLEQPLNPSAVHKTGREARKKLEAARQTILSALNAGSRDVLVFTSGATEANNMLLRGIAVEQIIVSAVEHPAVLNAVPDTVEKKIIPVRADGIVDIAALESMLAGNTRQTLVSVIAVNNETGVIQPITDIAAICRKNGALLHTDAVQAFGRIPVDVQAWQADFITLSAHKIGGVQGAGCLLIANCNAVAPLMRGGNQEKNLRAGTENMAAIAAFAAAVAATNTDDIARQEKLRDRLQSAITTAAPETIIFGKDAPRVGNTLMFALPGAPSESQLIALDLAGICVSNGSACSSGTVKSSHVLKAMGVPDDIAGCALRVSLGWTTTENDVDFFVAEWLKIRDRIMNRK